MKSVLGARSGLGVPDPSDGCRTVESPERRYRRQRRRQGATNEDRENGGSAFRPPTSGGVMRPSIGERAWYGRVVEVGHVV
jgi:hypothetical protein